MPRNNSPAFLPLIRGGFNAIQQRDFEFRMGEKVLVAIENTQRNPGADSLCGLAAFLAIEFVAGSRDNAAALFVPPVRPEDIERHR